MDPLLSKERRCSYKKISGRLTPEIRKTVIGMSSSISLLNGPCSRVASRELNPDVLQRLDGLFAFYHRQWWCHRQMFYHFKLRHNLLNGLALLIMAAGVIVGPILKNSILVACLTAAGVVVKGWNDFKKFSVKVGHVSLRLHHLRQNIDRVENLCVWSPFGGIPRILDQDANPGRYDHRFRTSRFRQMHI